MNETELAELDARLATRYGAYASFPTAAEPDSTDTHNDGPAEEMDRLLDRFVKPESVVLDLGCGAGQTLCRLAPKCCEIWGVDLEEPLIAAARARATVVGVPNATLVHGDTTDESVVNRLPEGRFSLVYSRRGPFLTHTLLPKLTADAHCIIELFQDVLGLKELFGRRPVLPSEQFSGGDWCVSYHSGLGMLPVSVRYFYFEQYFRDTEHLAAYLQTASYLSNWWMEKREFDPERDRPALELFARYNRTEDGIRLIQHRRIYVLRRAQTSYYPADGC